MTSTAFAWTRPSRLRRSTFIAPRTRLIPTSWSAVVITASILVSGAGIAALTPLFF